MTDLELQLIFSTAIDYNVTDRQRVNKLIKVAGYAQDLALNEEMEDDERRLLLAAAMLHDSGIRETERLYGSVENLEQLQNTSSEIIRVLLEPSNLTSFEIEAIAILVRAHHDQAMLDNPMHQLLVESIQLVELDEKNADADTIRHIRDSHFKTESGIARLTSLFPEAFPEGTSTAQA